MTVALAREVASRVAALDGVVAVALGGRPAAAWPPSWTTTAEAAGLPGAPAGFAAAVGAVLGGLSSDPATLLAALARMASLTTAVRDR